MLPALPVLLASLATAGGGPPNVLVLLNGDDPEAVATAEHYAAARQLPTGHLCALGGIDPLADRMDFEDFDTLVRQPLDSCLAALPQPEEIDYLVVIKGLPYLVDLPVYTASLDAVLQVGHASDGFGAELAGQPQDTSPGFAQASIRNPAFVPGSCSDLAITNPYAGWYVSGCGLAQLDALPATFHRTDDWAGAYDFTGELYAVTRLDGFDHADARALVDRALAADGSLPSAEIACMFSADEARGARDPECEYAIRLLEADGLPATWIDAFDGALAGRELAALFTGTTALQGALDGNTWVPGALIGNLTSYGAVPGNFRCSDDGLVCPQSESQTSIARFVRAGATGTQGTAAEPLNNSFPNAGLLLLYTSGYNLAESYLFTTQFLYWQNIVLGDPLTTPYALRPEVAIPAEVVEGEPLVITATHPDGVADLRLYVGGVRVAEADGDAISWEHGLAAGEQLELLAVARAKNATVQRTGWPVSEQTLRGRPEGWDTVTVTVTVAATAPPGEGAAKEGGCGCATGGSPISALWLLFGVVPGMGIRRP